MPVSLEPMPPNFAGVNALYSREFYELVATRLNEHGIAAHDPSKLVIDTRGSGLTGTQLQTRLREQSRLDVEFADPAHVVCSITVADDDESIDALLAALTRAVSGPGEASTAPSFEAIDLPPVPVMALTPRQVFGAPTVAVSLAVSLSGLLSPALETTAPAALPAPESSTYACW